MCTTPNTIQLKKLGKELILPRHCSPETESYRRGSFNQTASQSEPQERALSFQTVSGKHKLFKAHLFHLWNVIAIRALHYVFAQLGCMVC
jgi:hypothetical protein